MKMTMMITHLLSYLIRFKVNKHLSSRLIYQTFSINRIIKMLFKLVKNWKISMKFKVKSKKIFKVLKIITKTMISNNPNYKCTSQT